MWASATKTPTTGVEKVLMASDRGTHDDPDDWTPEHRTVRGHARWFVPLLLAPVFYYGCAVLLVLIPSDRDGIGALGFSLLTLVIAACVILGPVVCLVFVVRGLRRIWISLRRSRGHFSRRDRQKIAEARQGHEAVEYAIRLREDLLRGRGAPILRPADLMPAHGEVFHLRGACRYQRFYGQDVSYTTSSPMAYGRPLFVAAVMLTSAASNSAARSSAAAAARAQWREHQVLDTIVTDRRLFCRSAARGWLTFDYGGITAFHPDAPSQSIVLEFERGDPLYLSGPIVPAATMIMVGHRLGAEGLRSHASVQQLLASRGPAAARLNALEQGRF